MYRPRHGMKASGLARMTRNSNYNRRSNKSYSSISTVNTNTEMTTDGAIALFTIFVVFIICLAFPKLFFILLFIGLGILHPATFAFGIPLILFTLAC